MKNMNYNRVVAFRGATGFTLIELLLVLVILAVLAAVVAPKFSNRSEQAKQTAAKTEISTMATQLDAFEIDMTRYPSTEEGLMALIRPPASAQNWHGPYINANNVPKDPYGNEYVYRYPGTHNPQSYDLSSMGPDGHEGGNDDIDNWSH